MKRIDISWDEGWDSKTVLLSVVQQAQDGIRYDELKKRMRVLDVLENIKKGDWCFYLEDADWDVLKQCVNTFKFGAATKQLVKVLEAVMKAEEAKDASRNNSVPGERVPEERISNGVLASGPANGAAPGGNDLGTGYVDR